MIGHGALADLMRVPELGLVEPEARALSTALVNCADAWGFEPFADPRISTSIALAVTAVAIYGPRVGAIKARRPIEGTATGNAEEVHVH